MKKNPIDISAERTSLVALVKGSFGFLIESV